MTFAGIIAEYDPFHNGHAAQLGMVRARGTRYIAVCMSAGATQRGALPMWPEPPRVRAALLNGADLVVALPAPYACASAEGFAAAGAALLAALGCDTLAFGAETPDTARLMAAAEALLRPEFAAVLRRNLDAGQPFAAARAAAAETLCPGAGVLLQSPNNILAVEYCKAILQSGNGMAALALPRLGAAHGAPPPRDAVPGDAAGIASASALRRLAGEQGIEALRPYVPTEAYPLYKPEDMLDPAKVSLALLARLRGQTAADFAAVRGAGEGLDHRLANALQTATSIGELYQGLYTKRYPNARLHRFVLDAALGIPSDLPKAPPYLHILGARKAALPLLAQAKLPASTSLADLAKTGSDAARIAALHAHTVDLTALCRRIPGPAGMAFTQKPVILE